MTMISIVTPTLNAASTLARTIQSIGGQEVDYEHIIVDGGSTDGTLSIVAELSKRYPLKLVEKRDNSIYEGVQNGFEVARGDVWSWIGADDIYFPWTLPTVSALFGSREDVNWVCGLPTWLNTRTGIAYSNSFAPVYPRLLIRLGLFKPGYLGCIQQEGMFWRRHLWEDNRVELGKHIARYKFAADYHFWRQFSSVSRLYTLSTPLACFSLSPNQKSSKMLSNYIAESGGRGGVNSGARAGKLMLRLLSYFLFTCSIREV